MKKYCRKDYAVQIHILKADKAGDWWKFTVNIISVYKQGASRIRRGDQSLWIRSRDIACKCPKIKPLKKYLLLGNAEDSPDQSGIVADKSSLVIQWRDTWARRLRKFQQREKKGKCKKAEGSGPKDTPEKPQPGGHRLTLELPVGGGIAKLGGLLLSTCSVPGTLPT
ncbi:netrin-1-like [Leptonychotes weddellii]|uniref:Netrin-1-like n=1 Tax=Leptonychotes weddellii TaxID=9713 RepID=A0A7F8PVM9_LEPWE|nr:netrin-1-like [Leptonychotes weddellii]